MDILKDRLIFFVAINTGFITNGQPDERFIRFYTSRASSELYCAIIGNVVIPEGYGTNPSTPVLSDNVVWTKLAEKITQAGSVPGIQLATTWEGYRGSQRFVSRAPSQVIADAVEYVSRLGRGKN